jgi:hypothetical protein
MNAPKCITCQMAQEFQSVRRSMGDDAEWYAKSWEREAENRQLRENNESLQAMLAGLTVAAFFAALGGQK